MGRILQDLSEAESLVDESNRNQLLTEKNKNTRALAPRCFAFFARREFRFCDAK
jgi:hypothetical protein